MRALVRLGILVLVEAWVLVLLSGSTSAAGSTSGAGCTITWTGALDNNWHTVQVVGSSTFTNWTANALPAAGDSVCITAGTPILESDASIRDFQISAGATLSVPFAAALTATANSTNAGTIVLSAGGATVQAEDADPIGTVETITNSGTISFPAGGTAGLRTLAGDVVSTGTILVANAEATYQQSRPGENRNPKMTIANGATLTANASFRFLGSALELQAGGTINGIADLNIGGGGRLVLSGGTISPSTDVHLSLGELQFTGGTPTGKVRFPQAGGDNFLVGDVPSGITIDVEGSSLGATSLISTSSYTNAGTINLKGPITTLRTEDGVAGTTETLTNTGTITIPATGATGTRLIAGDLTNQGTITVAHPDGTFQQSGAEDRNPVWTNDGALTVSSGGALRFLDSALVQASGGTINGPGAINVAGGAFNPGTARRLTIAGGTIAANADVNLVGGDAALQFTGGVAALRFTGGSPSGNIDLTAGTHALSGDIPSNISLDFDGGAVLQSQTSFTNNGIIRLNAANAELRAENGNGTNAEKLTNNGTITFPAGGGSGFRFLGGDLDNNATITVDNPQSSIQTLADGRDPKLTNTASGTITVSGANTLRLLSAQSFSNAGTVSIDGAFNMTNGYVQTAGTTTVLAPGSISAGGGQTVAVQGGTLMGTGTAGPNVDNSGGSVQPGASPGTLTVPGTYTQGASGTLVSEVQGTTAGTTYDRLAVGGAASLAGTLTVAGTGFTPADSDTFDVVTFGSRTGTFATTNGLSSAGGGKTFNVVYNTTNVRFTVNPAPPVNTAAPAVTGTAQVGSTVTCDPGSWTGSPSFSYEWLRDGVAIGGQMASTYLLSAADTGSSIACRVTGTNGGGVSSATSVGHAVAAKSIDPPPGDPGITDPGGTPGSGMTGPPPAGVLPAPRFGRTVNVQPVSGSVLVRLPGTSTFVTLGSGLQVSFGSVIDARRGRVRITAAATPDGRLQVGEFYDGRFALGQVGGRRPVVQLKLFGGDFSGCGRSARAAVGTVAFAAGRRSRGSGREVRRLWGDAKGRWRTRGKGSATTVRGTVWLVSDRCDATLTRVRRGAVSVLDFARKRTVTVQAGKTYLAPYQP